MAEKAKVAINGFGRVGRALFRNYVARLARDNALRYEIVRINDREAPEMLGHLLRHDSIYGKASEHVQEMAQSIEFTQHNKPEQCDWQDVDLVIECTGSCRSRATLVPHLHQGARRVLLSAPPFDELDKMVVFGVTHQQIEPQHRLVSASSCTTNAAAITLNRLLECCDIERVWVTEIHGYTSGQLLLDNAHRDPRRARSATHNMIPTQTLGLDVVDQILPQLAGRICGYSMRVPLAIGACLDMTIELSNSVSAEAINRHFQANSSSLLGYSEEPLVSSDFVGRPESAILDATQTQVMANSLKLLVWFDNEWGYSNRMLDLVNYWLGIEH